MNWSGSDSISCNIRAHDENMPSCVANTGRYKTSYVFENGEEVWIRNAIQTDFYHPFAWLFTQDNKNQVSLLFRVLN